jgi:hypothetical protein
LYSCFTIKQGYQNRAAKEDDPRLTYAKGETKGSKRNSLKLFLEFENKPPPNPIVHSGLDHKKKACRNCISSIPG